MRKPFNNKSDYDPGRFRWRLQRVKYTSSANEFGNSDVTGGLDGFVKAIKIQPKDYDQYVINAGISQFNSAVYFVIRYNSNYTYTKDMAFICEGKTYKLHSIIEVDQPVKYLKLLCIWQG